MNAPGILADENDPGPARPDNSPEARRRLALGKPHQLPAFRPGLGPGSRPLEVIRRVCVGAFNDGFIHAGNLAYLAMLSIFPFFITGAAIFSAIGEEDERTATIKAILATLPPLVADVIRPVAMSVVEQRSGLLLWLGGLLGLWTVGGLIETIRDILRRSYGTRPTKAFWKDRLFSTGLILAAVFLLIASLFAQVAIGAAQAVIEAWFPRLRTLIDSLAWSRIIPGLGLYGSILMLFITLTPAAYRTRRYPKWPGALLVTAWWIGVTLALPPVLAGMIDYGLTYGSLAGMMIALFFFWLVGLGIVAGAELNAALAVTPEEERGRPGQADVRESMAKQEGIKK